jgi:hypothetical protein
VGSFDCSDNALPTALSPTAKLRACCHELDTDLESSNSSSCPHSLKAKNPVLQKQKVYHMMHSLMINESRSSKLLQAFNPLQQAATQSPAAKHIDESHTKPTYTYGRFSLCETSSPAPKRGEMHDLADSDHDHAPQSSKRIHLKIPRLREELAAMPPRPMSRKAFRCTPCKANHKKCVREDEGADCESCLFHIIECHTRSKAKVTRKSRRPKALVHDATATRQTLDLLLPLWRGLGNVTAI